MVQQQGGGDPGDRRQDEQDAARQRRGQGQGGAEDAEIGDDEEAEADRLRLPAGICGEVGRHVEPAQGQDQRRDQAGEHPEG